MISEQKERFEGGPEGGTLLMVVVVGKINKAQRKVNLHGCIEINRMSDVYTGELI